MYFQVSASKKPKDVPKREKPAKPKLSRETKSKEKEKNKTQSKMVFTEKTPTDSKLASVDPNNLGDNKNKDLFRKRQSAAEKTAMAPVSRTPQQKSLLGLAESDAAESPASACFAGSVRQEGIAKGEPPNKKNSLLDASVQKMPEPLEVKANAVGQCKDNQVTMIQGLFFGSVRLNLFVDL